MINIFWNIFELAVNIFEAANVMYFICTFLNGHIRHKGEYRYWIIGSLVYATTTTVLNTILDYEGILLSIYVIIAFLYSLLFLNGTILQKLFISVFQLACLMLVSTIITNLVTSAVKAPLTQVYSESGWVRLLTVILVQITDFYLFQILIRIFRNKDVRLRKIEWILLLTIFLLSTAIIVLIQLAQLKNDLTTNTRILLLFADVCIVIINIIIIKTISLLNQQYHTKIENELLHTKLQYQTQYTTAVQQQEESVKKQRHDIKNSMTVLHKLAEQEDINGIRKYIQQYIEHYHNEISFVHTNHTIVDAIINTKLSYANEMGINTVCLIDSNLPDISDTDYCSLLGNMLDNAIEASQNNKESPEIILEMVSANTQLRIRVKNKIQKSILNTNPYLRTTKSVPKKHGYGISILKEIASMYDGSTDFFEEDSYFIAQIVLYTSAENTNDLKELVYK